MQVSKVQNIKVIKQQKPNILKRICQSYADVKETIHDIYIYRKNRGPETYTEIGGKMVRDRDLPSCITRQSDLASMHWSEVKLYPEDQKIVDSLPPNEARIYTRDLLRAGKYIK